MGDFHINEDFDILASNLVNFGIKWMDFVLKCRVQVGKL